MDHGWVRSVVPEDPCSNSLGWIEGVEEPKLKPIVEVVLEDPPDIAMWEPVRYPPLSFQSEGSSWAKARCQAHLETILAEMAAGVASRKRSNVVTLATHQ